MNNRIIYINERLKQIEQEAVGASEALKTYLRIGYRLLLEERRKLIKTPADQLPIE